MAQIKDFLSFIYGNTYLLYIALGALILILSMFFRGRKVTLKKRKSQNFIKPIGFLLKIIDRVSFLSKLRDTLAVDVAIITKQNKSYNKKYAERLLSILIIIFFISFILTIVLLRYLVLIIFVPFTIFTFSIIVLFKIIGAKKKSLRTDIPDIIVEFTSKFAVSMNVLRSLQASMRHIPDTHKYEFSRLISALSSSDDYTATLDEYRKRIDDPFCDLFVELLKTNYIRNENILNGLIELQEYISSTKKLELSRHNGLFEQKLTIYACAILVIGGIVGMVWFLGQYAIDFYFHTFTGQLLIAGSALWIILSMIIMALLERLDRF